MNVPGQRFALLDVKVRANESAAAAAEPSSAAKPPAKRRASLIGAGATSPAEAVSPRLLNPLTRTHNDVKTPKSIVKT